VRCASVGRWAARSCRAAADRFVIAAVVLVVLVVMGQGCAHDVRVETNVRGARVRVDGVPVDDARGTTTFLETSRGRAIDLEVSAPGYATQRLRVRPHDVDPAVGIPTLAVGGGACVAAGCWLPATGVSLVAAGDVGAGVGLVLGGVVGSGCVAAAVSVIFANNARLPDVVFVELVPEAAGAAEGDVPPPPLAPSATTSPSLAPSATTPGGAARAPDTDADDRGAGNAAAVPATVVW
jgi:hypothetical protein